MSEETFSEVIIVHIIFIERNLRKTSKVGKLGIRFFPVYLPLHRAVYFGYHGLVVTHVAGHTI